MADPLPLMEGEDAWKAEAKIDDEMASTVATSNRYTQGIL